MSWLDGMVEENEASSQNERLDRTASAPEPGFFRGAGSQLFVGMGQGLTQLALQAAQYGNDPTQMISLDIPTDEEELARREAIGVQRREFSESMKPDPATVGAAGQILYGLGDIGSRFAFGLASGGPVVGAATVGGSVGEETFSDLKAKGVDTGTAIGAGAIQGTAAAIGAVLPAARFVRPLVGDAALAMGANVGLGIGSRAATGTILEQNGYTAQAAQYKAFDKTAVATDLVLGAAFFGLGRLGGARVTSEQVDAALTERTAQHADIDTAPGAPVTPRSAAAHQDAIRTAIEQLSRGERVEVPEGLHSAQFLRTTDEAAPVAPARDQAIASAREELLPTLRTELEQETIGSLPNVRDVRTELATVQRTLDGLDDTFRDQAKQFQQQGQSRKAAEASARNAIAEQRQQLSDRQATLSDSLEGNRTAELARADITALDRGETPKRFADRVDQRADAITQGFSKSPLAAGVAEGNKLSLSQIARQEITRILDDLERLEPTLQARSLDIPASTVLAKPETAATPGASKGPSAASESAKAASDTTENASAAGKPAADPELQVADEILARVDDIRIATGAIDADGNAVTVSAREMMAEADMDVQRAQQDSKGFAAAAACFLQRGDG